MALSYQPGRELYIELAIIACHRRDRRSVNGIVWYFFSGLLTCKVY